MSSTSPVPWATVPKSASRISESTVKLGIPMVGVHFNGRLISSHVAEQYLDAILEAWNPSEMGAPAISAVLRGEYNPGEEIKNSVDIMNTGTCERTEVIQLYLHDLSASCSSLSLRFWIVT